MVWRMQSGFKHVCLSRRGSHWFVLSSPASRTVSCPQLSVWRQFSSSMQQAAVRGTKMDFETGVTSEGSLTLDGNVLHPLWLRQRCRAAGRVHSGSNQRLFEVSDLNGVKVLAVNRSLQSSEQLEVEFSDGHSSKFVAQELLDEIRGRSALPAVEPWDARKELSDFVLQGNELVEEVDEPSRARSSYRVVHSGMLALMRQLLCSGMAIVRDLPVDREAFIQIVSFIGPMRETNWGAVWDVKSGLEAMGSVSTVDVANSSQYLALHTDNPYREPVPGFQLLFCIKDSAVGGESIIADGFAVAAHLRENNLQAFETLSSVEVAFEYQDASVLLRRWAPHLEVDKGGEVTAINWSGRLDFAPPADTASLQRYFDARQLMHECVSGAFAPRFQHKFKLHAGDLLLFDNRRCLHGRTAFPAGSPRHLTGCYMDKDSISSTFFTLRRKLAQ